MAVGRFAVYGGDESTPVNPYLQIEERNGSTTNLDGKFQIRIQRVDEIMELVQTLQRSNPDYKTIITIPSEEQAFSKICCDLCKDGIINWL